MAFNTVGLSYCCNHDRYFDATKEPCWLCYEKEKREKENEEIRQRAIINIGGFKPPVVFKIDDPDAWLAGLDKPARPTANCSVCQHPLSASGGCEECGRRSLETQSHQFDRIAAGAAAVLMQQNDQPDRLTRTQILPGGLTAWSREIRRLKIDQEQRDEARAPSVGVESECDLIDLMCEDVK